MAGVQYLSIGGGGVAPALRRPRDDGREVLAALMQSLGRDQAGERDANLTMLGLLMNNQQGNAGLAQRESEFSRSLDEERASRNFQSEQAGKQWSLLNDQFLEQKSNNEKQWEEIKKQSGMAKDQFDLSKQEFIDTKRENQRQTLVDQTAAKLQYANTEEHNLLNLKMQQENARIARQQKQAEEMVSPIVKGMQGRAPLVFSEKHYPTAEEIGLFDDSVRTTYTAFSGMVDNLKKGGLTPAEASGALGAMRDALAPIVNDYYSLPADRQEQLAKSIGPVEKLYIAVNSAKSQLPEPDAFISSAIDQFGANQSARHGAAQSIADTIRNAPEDAPFADIRNRATSDYNAIGGSPLSMNAPDVQGDIGDLLKTISTGLPDRTPPVTDRPVDPSVPNSLVPTVERGVYSAIAPPLGVAGAAAGVGKDTLIDVLRRLGLTNVAAGTELGFNQLFGR